MPLQIRRGLQADRDALANAVPPVPLSPGELLFALDTGNLYIGDAAATGGGRWINQPPIIALTNYTGTFGQIEKEPGTPSPFITITNQGTASIDLDGQVTTNIRPNSNEIVDIGNDDFRFNRVFVGGNGVVIGGSPIFETEFGLELPANTRIGGQSVATGLSVVTGGTYSINISTPGITPTVIVDSATATFNGTLKGNVTNLDDDVIFDIDGGLVFANLKGDILSPADAVIVDSTNGLVTADLKGNVLDSAGNVVVDTADGLFSGDLVGNVLNSIGSVIVDTSLSVFTGDVVGRLKGNILDSLDETVFNVDAKSISLEEINLEGISVISGNPVFVSNLATFVSPVPSLTVPTVSVAVISSASNVGGSLALTRARGTIGGGEAIVANNDEVGSLEFSAYNGISFDSVGNFTAIVDGAPTPGQPAPIKVDVNLSNGTSVNNVLTFKSSQVEFSAVPIVPNLDSTAITTLAPVIGMVIYNTTTNKFQGYQNTGGTTPEWVDLS